MALHEDIRIEVSSDPRLLCSLRRLITGYLDTHGFSEDRIREVVLAVDEACANSIRHSYGGRKDQRITLSLSANNRGIKIVLCDEGTPACLEKVNRKKPAGIGALSPTRRNVLKPGGLGVQIMRRVFDRVVFQPGKDRGNRITMTLKRVAVHKEEGNVSAD